MYGESNMETYITVCKIDSQWKFSVCLRELKPGLVNNLDLQDGERGGRRVQVGIAAAMTSSAPLGNVCPANSRAALIAVFMRPSSSGVAAKSTSKKTRLFLRGGVCWASPSVSVSVMVSPCSDHRRVSRSAAASGSTSASVRVPFWLSVVPAGAIVRGSSPPLQQAPPVRGLSPPCPGLI